MPLISQVRNLEVEDERALVPDQHSSNQDVNPQHPPLNLNPTTLHAQNHLLNFGQYLKDQQAYVLTNQDTNANNVVFKHLYQNTNPVFHYVENNFTVHGSNQQMNRIDEDEVNSHEPAYVLTNQDTNANNEVFQHLYQVENNLVEQNYHNVGSLYDLIAPPMSPTPLQMTSSQRMIHPLAEADHSPVTGFNNNYLLENLPPPPRAPPLPPQVVEHAHPGMYLSGPSYNPPAPSGQAEAPAFQNGNDSDVDHRLNHYIKLLLAQDGDDGILEPGFDNEQLDAA